MAVLAAVSAVALGACGPSAPSPTASPGPSASTATSGPVTTTTTPASPAGLSPSALADPFLGTGVGGSSVGSIDTFPGADMPFGMVQWSPDTTPDRTSGGGYSYRDSAITGFSLTHMSGPGCAVYGDIPILPTVGAIGADPGASSSPFSHSTEVASPGNYAVTVGKAPVRVRLAVTTERASAGSVFPARAAPTSCSLTIRLPVVESFGIRASVCEISLPFDFQRNSAVCPGAALGL